MDEHKYHAAVREIDEIVHHDPPPQKGSPERQRLISLVREVGEHEDDEWFRTHRHKLLNIKY